MSTKTRKEDSLDVSSSISLSLAGGEMPQTEEEFPLSLAT